MAIPTKDTDLASWSTNANTRLTASPATYGTTAPVAAQYDTVHDAFIAAYNAVLAARESGVRSGPLVTTKDDAKQALLNFARPLYKQIQANTAVTDTAKVELGVIVPDTDPSPIPAPDDAPAIDILDVVQRTVKIRLHDTENPTSRARPAGVDGASVFSYVGATAPADIAAWKFEGSTTRTEFDVEFPVTVAPFSKVWLTAFWFNPTMQSGPACPPVDINLGTWLVQAA